MKKSLIVAILIATSTLAFTQLFDRDDLMFLIWDNNTQSLIVNNKRGLGGGIEYQISAQFCEKITPLFIEEIHCDELEEEIQKGLSKWSNVQPKIFFKKLPSQYKAIPHKRNDEYIDYRTSELGIIKAIKSPEISSQYSEHGGEIDFFAIDAWDEDLEEIAFFAYTTLIWQDKKPKNLLGININSSSMMSSDIYFNTDPKICYYKDQTNPNTISIPKRCKKVLRFTFVITHEAGHALALEHVRGNHTIMGRSNDRVPNYKITKTDAYHLLRIYPNSFEDLKIQNSHEDEFILDDEPDYR